MSVQSEIDRIKKNVDDTLKAISDTGVQVGMGSDALPAAARALANEKQDKLTGTVAVSYTHLDVYKRQLFIRFSRLFGLCGRPIRRPWTSLKKNWGSRPGDHHAAPPPPGGTAGDFGP